MRTRLQSLALSMAVKPLSRRATSGAETVILMLRQLGHYVEVACKGGHEHASSRVVSWPLHRTRSAEQQPVGQPAIASVSQGTTGQLVVTIQAVPKARHYEFRYAAVPVAGAAISWTTLLLPTTKPPTVLNNLTPGGTYTFQVRAYGKLGYSDWSSTVDRMCI